MDSAFREDLLAGRHAFVTGGGSGIGLAIAQAFARHGAHVVIASRDEARLRNAVDLIGHGARYHVADVRDAARLQEVAAAEERVDILVNAAAGNFVVPFRSMSSNAWTRVVDIVLNGTAHAAHAFQDHLHATKGSMINIVAGYAWTGAPGVSHSGAAKAGVLDLTRSLAVEWGPDVRVNAVSPGPVAGTEGMKRLAGDLGMEDVVRRQTPMGRFAKAEEVADACLFLAGRGASYVTGACLVVDGGQDAMGPFGPLWAAMRH